MAGVQRSAGAVYYDVALGSTAKAVADAQAARVEIDKALNEGGNSVSISASNGQSAGDAYAKGFTSKTSSVADGIKKSLGDAEKTSGSSGDTSGSSWRTSFDKHISDMRSAFTSSFKNIEADAGGSGGRSGDNWGSKFFGSASGWFKKLQDKETGMLGSLGAFAPLGIAAGAGALGGAGALATSVAAPAVGLAAGGGLMASLVSQASTDLTNVQGAGNAAAQAKALAALTVPMQGFVKALESVKTAFAGIQNKEAPLYVQSFSSLMATAVEIITKATPIFTTMGQNFKVMGNSIQAAVGGSAFTSFMDKINQQLQSGAFIQFATGIGDIAAGLGKLFTNNILSGSDSLALKLDNLGATFDQWSTSASARADVTKFLDYLKTNGSSLGNIVKNIADALGKLGPSAASFGSSELNILSGFFGLITKLPASAAGPLVSIISSLLLFQKFNGFSALSSISKFFGSDTIASIGKFALAMGGAAVAAARWVAEMVIAAVTMDTDTIALKLMYLWDGLVSASEAVAAMASRLLALAMDAIPIVLIVVALIALVAAIVYYHTEIINFVIKVWNEIYAFLKQWWYVLVLAIFTGGMGLVAGIVYKYHNDIFSFIEKIWGDVEGFLKSTWHTIETDVSNAWDSVYNKVTGTATNIWHDTVKTLGHMASDIAGVFKTIGNTGFIDPINLIIKGPIDGVIGAIDAVAGIVGIKNAIDKVQPIQHLAAGGIVKGGIAGKDSVPAMLMPDEVVLSTSQVAKLGGHQAIANMVGGAHPQNIGGVIHAGWGWNPISDAKQAASDVGSGVSKATNWAKGLVLGGVADALGAVINPLVGLIPTSPDMSNVVHGMAQTAVADILNWVRGQDKAANQSTAGVNLPGNAVSWITQGMQIAGRGTDATWLKGLEIIAQGESGGNQSSVNTTDSNAQAGHPSAGLMQFIQSTFSSYAKPGYTTWMNPVDQVIADAWSGGYIQQRYGGIDNVPGVKSVLGGGAYVGYDSGGWLQPGVTATYNGIGAPEAILTPDQWTTMESLASRGASTPNINVSVYLGNEEFDDYIVKVAADELGDALAGGMVTT